MKKNWTKLALSVVPKKTSWRISVSAGRNRNCPSGGASDEQWWAIPETGGAGEKGTRIAEERAGVGTAAAIRWCWWHYFSGKCTTAQLAANPSFHPDRAMLLPGVTLHVTLRFLQVFLNMPASFCLWPLLTRLAPTLSSWSGSGTVVALQAALSMLRNFASPLLDKFGSTTAGYLTIGCVQDTIHEDLFMKFPSIFLLRETGS